MHGSLPASHCPNQSPARLGNRQQPNARRVKTPPVPVMRADAPPPAEREALAALDGWYRLAEIIARPEVELDLDVFCSAWRGFELLRRHKLYVDPMAAALLLTLADQVFATEDGVEDHDDELDATDAEPIASPLQKCEKAVAPTRRISDRPKQSMVSQISDEPLPPPPAPHHHHDFVPLPLDVLATFPEAIGGAA